MAIKLSIKTKVCKKGIGCPRLLKQTIACFKAIVVITNGKVNDAKLG